MELQTVLARLQAGLSPAQAVELFEQCCRRPKTLFITERWFAPFKRQFLDLLTNPITAEEAHVLQEIIFERVPIKLAMEWLKEQPRSTWEGLLEKKRLEEERLRREAIRLGFFPWPDVEVCRNNDELQRSHLERSPAQFYVHGDHSRESIVKDAQPCPECGAPFENLACFYFTSPAWTWQKLCGRAGWLTVCDQCHIQVQFFVEIMN